MLPLTGIVKVAPFLDMSEEDWDSVIDVNLKGVFLVRPVAVLMLDAKTGFPCSWLPIYPFSSPGSICCRSVVIDIPMPAIIHGSHNINMHDVAVYSGFQVFLIHL